MVVGIKNLGNVYILGWGIMDRSQTPYKMAKLRARGNLPCHVKQQKLNIFKYNIYPFCVEDGLLTCREWMTVTVGFICEYMTSCQDWGESMLSLFSTRTGHLSGGRRVKLNSQKLNSQRSDWQYLIVNKPFPIIHLDPHCGETNHVWDVKDRIKVNSHQGSRLTNKILVWDAARIWEARKWSRFACTHERDFITRRSLG